MRERMSASTALAGRPLSSYLQGPILSDFALYSWNALMGGADLFSIAGVTVINLSYSQATHLGGLEST